MFNKKNTYKIIVPIVGFFALIWFLIRVIPKPGRATYPCQRAAFPLASSFVIWFIGLITSAFAFKKADHYFRKSNLVFAFFFVVLGLLFSSVFTGTEEIKLFAKTYESADHPANEPVGEAKGIFPGRVVWAWNPDAVNENTKNTWREGDNWWMEENTNKAAVNEMLEKSMLELTGEVELYDAWDAVFRYFNTENKRGNKGYEPGEKITMKINLVSCDASNMDGHNKVQNLNMIDGSPQVMYAVLYQLTNMYGVNQQDISLGDPSSYFPNQYYDILKDDFPNVTYLSLGGQDGRTKIIPTGQEVIKFSDGNGGDDIPQQFVDADYMINISVLKHHTSAGFSQIAKNHYGSNTQNTASHMHYSLVKEQPGMGHYRHLVDWLGHEHLGGKTILNIGDFLWSGDRAWTPPKKFMGKPFNGDYPSSILVSQDPVAIESVGLDFIKTQQWQDNLASTEGVDDFLHQAADPEFWPEGLTYDPEGDGTTLQSLGVHEHWNNPDDKQYSRNLGTGEGIELIPVFLQGIPDEPQNDTGAISFEIISFTDIKPEGFPLQYCWNALGIDPQDNVYIAFGNAGLWEGRKEDVALFTYNTKENTPEFISTFNQVLKDAGNLHEDEYVSKGHTDIVYMDGKMYMGTQPYHAPNKDLSAYRGSHLLAYDIEKGQLMDLSKDLSGGIVQEDRGLLAVAAMPDRDYIVGYGNPTGDLVFYNTKTGAIDKVVPGLHKNGNITRVIIPTADGKLYFSWGWDQMYVYDLETDQVQGTGSPGGKPFWNGWAKTNDNALVYIADPEGTIYELNTQAGSLSTLGNMGSNILGLALSADENLIYSIINSGGYKLVRMEAKTGKTSVAYSFPDNFGKGTYTFTGNNVRDSKGNIYFARHQNNDKNTDGRYDAELVKISFNNTLPVNVPPIADKINNFSTLVKNEYDTIQITGISDGNNGIQNLEFEVIEDETRHITSPQIHYETGNDNAYLTFMPRAAGTVTISIIIEDDGIKTTGGPMQTELSFSVRIKDESTHIQSLKPEHVIIFPNPAKDILHVKSKSEISKVEIFSLSGKKLVQKTYIQQNTSVSIPLSGLAKGEYLLTVYLNKKIKTFIFVKE